MSDTVPAGWDYKQLGDYVADSAAGEWGTEAQGDDNDIPVLRSTNFTESGVIDYTKLAFRNIEEKKRTKKALKKGDILLEKSGGSPTQPVGRVVYFDRDTPHLYSNFTQKLAPAKNCESKYLFYKLYFEYQNGTVLKFQQQTTGIINFQLAEYLGFQTVFAPLPEQQRIAAILSSVDDVIEKTRAQIDKLKDLKTGMMQELLTKGIGSGGVPHTEFKNSPVGRIPVGWEVNRISDICSEIVDCVNKTAPVVDCVTPYKMIRTTNVRNGRIIMDGMRYVTKDTFETWSRRISLQNGDLIFTREAPVGECGLIRDATGLFLGQRTMVYRAEPKKVDKFFLLSSMQSEYFKSQIDDLSGGSTTPHLRVPDCSKILIKIPPMQEQQKISIAIQSVEHVAEEKKGKLERLESIKKALMQDLLTGKLRVKTDQRESVVA